MRLPSSQPITNTRPQRKITAEQLLHNLIGMNFEKDSKQTQDHFYNYLIRYAAEASDEWAMARGEENSPGGESIHLILDLFFAYSEKYLIISHYGGVNEKLGNWVEKYAPVPSRETQVSSAKYNLASRVGAAISMCEKIIFFLEGDLSEKETQEVVEFLKAIETSLLDIINNPNENRDTRLRAVHFIGLVVEAFTQKRIENPLPGFQGVPEDLQIATSDLLQSLREVDLENKCALKKFSDKICTFVLGTMGHFERAGIENSVENRNRFFLLILLPHLSQECFDKFTGIFSRLPTNTVLASLEVQTYVKISSPLGNFFLKEVIQVILNEFRKVNPKEMNASFLRRCVFSGEVLCFLDDNFLDQLKEVSSKGLLPPDVVAGLKEIAGLIDSLKEKCISLFFNSGKKVFVGSENRNFAILFLSIPTIFQSLSGDQREKVLVALKCYLESKFKDLCLWSSPELLKTKDWLSHLDVLSGVIEELSQTLNITILFLNKYQEKSSLPQNFQEFLSSARSARDNLSEILKKMREAQDFYSSLGKLYEKHVAPLIVYLGDLLSRVPERRSDLQAQYKTILDQLRNQKEFIKSHYQSFVNLKAGEISPRQLMDKIVAQGNASSITVLIGNSDSFLLSSKTSSSWFGPSTPLEPLKNLSEFLSSYEQHSQKELKSNSLLSIDFSIFKCTYIPPVTQGVRERPVERGERMRVLERSNAPVDWNALYPVDQPVPDYSQLIDMSVFSNTYTPSLSFSVDEKEKEYVLK